MINIKDFQSSFLKTDKKKIIKNYWLCHNKKIEYFENINSVNPLYLIIGQVDWYMEENNRNNYLVFTSTNNNKKILAKFLRLWDEIEYLIKIINGDKKDKYEKYFMKIRFESDDHLPLNKILKLHVLAVFVRFVFWRIW